MGNLFKGRSSRTTDADKAVLNLKVNRNHLTQYSRKIQQQLNLYDNEIRLKLSKNDRIGALKRLKMKKDLEKLIDRIDENILEISKNINAIQEAQMNIDIASVLENGNAALKHLNHIMSIDKVEQTLQELDENSQTIKEISILISSNHQTVDDIDESELEKELLNLDATTDIIKNTSFPEVPSHPIERLPKNVDAPIKSNPEHSPKALSA